MDNDEKIEALEFRIESLVERIEDLRNDVMYTEGEFTDSRDTFRGRYSKKTKKKFSKHWKALKAVEAAESKLDRLRAQYHELTGY